MDEADEEEEGEGDVGSSTSERRYRRRSLFSLKRLNIPPSRVIRKCMDIMMGCANRATIKSLRKLPLRHKCVILCRNMAEKFALEQEIRELKVENDSMFKISSQVKADVEMVMEENQTLEKENEKL
ncbi:hypothetical protein Dimus_030122 [Dionaea muscipula]